MIRKLVILGCTAAFCLSAPFAWSQTKKGPDHSRINIEKKSEHREGRLIVKYKSDAIANSSQQRSNRISLSRDFGTRIEQAPESLRRRGIRFLQHDKLSDVAYERLINKLQSDESVEYVELDYTYHATATPNDTLYSQLWAMPKIDAPDGWNDRTDASSVIVAVLDTGINQNHSEFSNRRWQNPGEISGNGIDDDGNGYVDDVDGWDFINSDRYPWDDHVKLVWAGEMNQFPGDIPYDYKELYTCYNTGPYSPPTCIYYYYRYSLHGTHVSGTIGAAGNNNSGVTGVAWNSDIMPVKVLSKTGYGSSSAIADGIKYAVNNGAMVINMSLGSSSYSNTIKDAIDYAETHGVVIVAAAGNDSLNTDTTPHYPSAYSNQNIISVAATNTSNQFAYFSNYGKHSVDIAAPGEAILSTYKTGQYDTKEGTSMASPLVAGAVALAFAEFPNESYRSIMKRVLNAGEKNANLVDDIDTDSLLNLDNIFDDKSELAHFSIRANVKTGQNVAVAGFVIEGNATKRIHARVLGPSVAGGTLPGTLQNPKMEVKKYPTGQVLYSNDNYTQLSSAHQTELSNAGVLPGNSNEPALVMDLAPGAYTIRIEGVNNTTGIVVFGLWDRSLGNGSSIVNASGRTWVGTGADLAVMGLQIAGTHNKRLVARAQGPTLTSLGVPVLADPHIELKSVATGLTLETNDDWRDFDGTSTAFEDNLVEYGLNPPYNSESALSYSFEPGYYTLKVLGNSPNNQGIAIFSLNEY